MKGFTAAATAVAGATLFLQSAYAQIDPIVIKVRPNSPALVLESPEDLTMCDFRVPNSSINPTERNCE